MTAVEWGTLVQVRVLSTDRIQRKPVDCRAKASEQYARIVRTRTLRVQTARHRLLVASRDAVGE
jgi:hypothetical protein